MRFKSLATGTLLLLGNLVSQASATVYTENFEAPFPAWESGWFGTNSNAQNYYGVGQGRGNNPDGLWIADGLANGSIAEIAFKPSFAASLSSFSFDVAGHAPTTLTFYDSNFNVLSSTNVTLTSGAFTDPGNYVRYSVVSNTGIGGFSFSGFAEGNTSIDNIEAASVPGPIVGAGLPGLLMAIAGFIGWRRSRLVWVAACSVNIVHDMSD